MASSPSSIMRSPTTTGGGGSLLKHDREAAEEAALSRRLRLRDKMVGQVVKQFHKFYPEITIDQRSVDVIRHQLGQLLLNGSVSQGDLAILVKGLRKSLDGKYSPEKDQDGEGGGGERVSTVSGKAGKRTNSSTAERGIGGGGSGSVVSAQQRSTTGGGSLLSQKQAAASISSAQRLPPQSQPQQFSATQPNPTNTTAVNSSTSGKPPRGGTSKGGSGATPFDIKAKYPLLADESVFSRATVDSKELHKVAQEVRSLPQLIQKKIMLKKSQDVWQEQFRKEAEEVEAKQLAERLRAAEVREEQRKELGEQVKRRDALKRAEKQDTLATAAELLRQREEWVKSEAAQVEKRQREAQTLKKDLMQQRSQALLRKREEEDRRKFEEEDKAEQLRDELKQEEDEKAKKREQIRRDINSYLEYNQQMKAIKDEEKRKLAEMDVKILREYEEKLEKQEQQRQEYLRKIHDRQSRKYEMADAQYKNIQTLAQADELKAFREQEELDKKAKAREDATRKKKWEEEQRTKEVIEKQIQEKETQKRNAKEESQRIRQEILRNSELAETKELLRRQKAKEFALKGLKDIDKQLVELHQRRFLPPAIKVGEKPEKLSPK